MKYGFGFWLGWIVGFAGLWVASAAVWTFALPFVIGPFTGPAHVVCWSLAVFGSWFLLVIPFMRQKERIWKRLNTDEERAVDAWLAALGYFILLVAGGAVFWTAIFRERLARGGGFDMAWLKAVLATWLLGLVPGLVFMYRQADRIFRAASERQGARRYRKTPVPRAARLLDGRLARRLADFKETLPGAYVVTAVLSDGRRVPHVFVRKGGEILGVYDRGELGFRGSDVADVLPMGASDLIPYEEDRWLRVDGGA